jgi:hypothetical protein
VQCRRAWGRRTHSPGPTVRRNDDKAWRR